MKLEVEVGHGLSEAIGEVGSKLRDAADAAVVATTNRMKNDMRGVIAAGLGDRAANTLRDDFFFGPHQEVIGWLFSKWWRTGARDGQKIDMIAVFECGGIIASPFGGALALPLPAAYNVLGLAAGSWRGRQPGKLTPQAVEIKLGQRLGIVKTKRGNLLLVARNVVRSRSSRGTVRAATYHDRRGRLRQRVGESAAVVPMFVLLRNMVLPRRVDFRAIRASAPQRLAENFLIEMAQRDL